MKTRSNLGLILAAACLTMATVSTVHAQPVPQLVTNHLQVDPGDRAGSDSADRNVIDSQRYERMLKVNATFREQRMSKECGSIDDPNLHEQCLVSFR